MFLSLKWLQQKRCQMYSCSVLPLFLCHIPLFLRWDPALMWLVKGHILFQEIKQWVVVGSLTPPSMCRRCRLPGCQTSQRRDSKPWRWASGSLHQPHWEFLFSSHICLGPLDKMPPFDLQPEPFLPLFYAAVSGGGRRCDWLSHYY